MRGAIWEYISEENCSPIFFISQRQLEPLNINY